LKSDGKEWGVTRGANAIGGKTDPDQKKGRGKEKNSPARKKKLLHRKKRCPSFKKRKRKARPTGGGNDPFTGAGKGIAGGRERSFVPLPWGLRPRGE